MLREVEPFVFLLVSDAQSERRVEDLQDHPRHHPTPRRRGHDAQRLHGHLASHGHAIRITHSAQSGIDEHPGENRPHDPAHAVHRRNVQRVIDMQHPLQHLRSAEAHHSGNRANNHAPPPAPQTLKPA